MTRRWAPRLAPLILALAACPAPRPVVRPQPSTVAPAASPRPLPVPLAPAEQHDEFALDGVVHVVRRGETMYRIARAYGIDPADLMETNGIADPRNVDVGTELFVPGATRVLEIEPAPSTSTSTPASTAMATAAATSTTTRTPTPTATRTPTSTPVELSSHTPAPARAPTPPRSGRDAPLAWPLKGVLYGRYGVRAGRRHDGIDIAAPEGTAVGAAGAGTVIFAGEQAGYGAIVIVKHEGGLVTLYAHNSRLLVEEGAHVRRGEPIARVGQTGRTTGPHLHFEVRDGTRPRNPLLYLP